MIFDNEVMASEITFYKIFPKILRQCVIKLVYDVFLILPTTPALSHHKKCAKSWTAYLFEIIYFITWSVLSPGFLQCNRLHGRRRNRRDLRGGFSLTGV